MKTGSGLGVSDPSTLRRGLIRANASQKRKQKPVGKYATYRRA